MVEQIAHVVLTSCLSLLWLGIMFTPLESTCTARDGQGRFLKRHGFVADLGFFFGQYWVFTALIALGLLPLFDLLQETFPMLLSVQQSFGSWPVVLQVVVVLVAGDFMMYWGHRLQHNNALLWRFHSVHHTTQELDWLAAHREHPLDGLWTQGLMNIPAVCLGFDVSAMVGLVTFRGLWAIFIHSNVKVPLGPLHYLLGDPVLHRWHHAKSRHVGNYANLAPWLDLAFGTYHCPDHLPDELGVEESSPDSYWKLLLWPFRPN